MADTTRDKLGAPNVTDRDTFQAELELGLIPLGPGL